MKCATVATLAVFAVILVTASSGQKITANPIPSRSPINLVLTSSQKVSYNLTSVYNVPDILITLTIQLGTNNPLNREEIRLLNYSLDGQTPIPITPAYLSTPSNLNATANFRINNLSDGLHNLLVQGETNLNETVYANINFTVFIPVAAPAQRPTLEILFPMNDSFFNVSLGGVNYQLMYETNSPLSWVGYSLDGSDYVTVAGNSTSVHQFVSSNGYHTLTVYANDTLGTCATPQSVTYLVNFYPDYTPASSSSPTPTSRPVYIGLSESASALNYGETVTFTASPPDGGTSPFTFTWYMDNQQAQVVQRNDSDFFSTNTLPVGSHHVYVEVKDANGNIATTNTVEFNVIPASSSSPYATQEPSSTPNLPQENPTSAAVIVGGVIAIVVVVGLLAYAVMRRQSRRSS